MVPMEIKQKCAQYLRVSSEEQVANGYGLDVQKEKNNALATLKDFEISDDCIYSDEGLSGTLPPDKRPQLKQMLEDAEAGKFDTLIVYKIDRIARDNYITLGVVKRLTACGVKLISATEPFDTSTTIGNYMVQLLGATAEMDRNNIVERTTAGRKMSAQKGTWVFGSPAYGYKYNKETQRLEIKEDEAKWVKQFYEWLVYDQLPLREIAHRANELKIPTQETGPSSRQTTTGLWYPRTLGRILSNDTYTGVKYLGKYRKSPRNFKMATDPKNMNPESEWVAVSVLPIISEEMYLYSLRQLKRNSELAARKKIRDYMFSGLLHCSDCGYKFRGGFAKPTSKTANGSRFYLAIQSGRESKLADSKKCKYCGSVSESRLMPIWYALEKILLNPEIVFGKLERHASQNTDESKQESLESVRLKREQLDKDRQRLNIAFIDVGSIDSREYKTKLKIIDEKLNLLVQEETNLVGTLLSKEEQVDGKVKLKKLFKQYKKNIENASYEKKMQILQIFVNSIDINLANNMATVQLNFANVNVLKDNPRGGGPSKSSQVTMTVPIITTKEIALAEYPTHSKYYKAISERLPLVSLSKRKVKGMKIIAS